MVNKTSRENPFNNQPLPERKGSSSSRSGQVGNTKLIEHRNFGGARRVAPIHDLNKTEKKTTRVADSILTSTTTAFKKAAVFAGYFIAAIPILLFEMSRAALKKATSKESPAFTKMVQTAINLHYADFKKLAGIHPTQLKQAEKKAPVQKQSNLKKNAPSIDDVISKCKKSGLINPKRSLQMMFCDITEYLNDNKIKIENATDEKKLYNTLLTAKLSQPENSQDDKQRLKGEYEAIVRTNRILGHIKFEW